MNDIESNSITNDPDINPMEKLGEICEHLKEYVPTVHYPGDIDSEYDYLEPDCACITLNNPFNESRMFIDLHGEFTLTYGNWHTHYSGCISQYKSLIEDIDNILTNQSCAASLFTGLEKNWLGNRLITKNQMEQFQVQKIFSHIFNISEFRKKIHDNGGIVEFRFWNSTDDKNIIIKPS